MNKKVLKMKNSSKEPFCLGAKEFIENYSSYKINDLIIFRCEGVGEHKIKIGQIDSVQVNFSGDGSQTTIDYYVSEIVINKDKVICVSDPDFVEEDTIITHLCRAKDVIEKELEDV